MARTVQENGIKADQTDDKLVFQADGADRIDLPSTDFIADAKMTRDGDNLILETPNGETAVVEGYFSAEPAPVLHAPDGSVLTSNLVDAFARSPLEFAANNTASDQSPVGAVEEVKGDATVTRADGTVETITNGTPIYQGDIVQTDAEGAVNIVFIDETSMAISANARLAIDEYSYDPSTESGTTNFSVLRGLFVFTSGLIGRDDPDDVKIDTPVGSIGIRGTIIAGEINPGGESNISVLEGAIVIKNGEGELTLSEQFETVRLMGFDQPMKDMGVVSASDINTRFSSVSDVNASLFTMINDAVKEQSSAPAPEAPKVDVAPEPTSSNEQQAPAQDSLADTRDVFTSIDGSTANLNTTASTGLPSDAAVTGQPSSGLPATGTTISSTGTNGIPQATSGSGINAAGQTGQNTLGDTQLASPTVLGTTASAGTGTIAIPAWAKIELATMNAASHHLIADNISNGFGFSISALGDVNNDGFADFVVGKDSAFNNHSYVFNGSIAGITATTPAGTTVNNATGTENFTNSLVAGVGDVNGDGTQDYVVGQSFNGTGAQGQIRFELYNSGSGLYVPGTLLNGSAANNEYGASISGIGDINNDGYADIVVGAPGSLGGDGKAYLLKGSNSAPISTELGTGGSSDQYGGDVSGIGDFNGDGYSDLAIGAPGGNYIDIYTGERLGAPTSFRITDPLALGDAFGTEVRGLGDINGDGYSDLMVGGENSGNIFFGNSSGTGGRIDLSVPPGSTIAGGGAAGDFNGDGYKDFTISFDNGTRNETYIVFGKSTIGSSVLDYTYLNDYRNAIKVAYPTNTDALGDVEISSIGDVNGDGYDDIGIGVEDAHTLAPGDGGVFVVYGRETGPHPGAIVGSSGNDILSDNNQTGMSLRGGAGNDIFNLRNTDFLSIDGGGGTIDTIRTINGLNFSNVDFENVSGIEKIQFGATNQTLTLTMENIFNLLKSSDTGTLKIEAPMTNSVLNIDALTATGTGTNTNIVNALNEHGNGAAYSGTDGIYRHFTIGGYDLYIADNANLTVSVV